MCAFGQVNTLDSTDRIGLVPAVLIWFLFFLICLGLGYPTVTRYDPRASGLADTIVYYDMVMTGDSNSIDEHMRFRVLVPFVARQFYRLADGRFGTRKRVFFGMLVANSLLVATTAFLVVKIGYGHSRDFAVALLGAAIYLLNFEIPNLRLAGLIDAGEGCFLLFLCWCLLKDRWWLLPLCGVLGVLSKESFVPYSTILVLTWWLVSSYRHPSRLARAIWFVSMVVVECVANMILQKSQAGRALWPWQFAATISGGSGYLRRFVVLLADRQSWYDYIWLLPLGVWRLKRLPCHWVLACATTVLCALSLCAYHNAMPGTWGRATFSIGGPLLSISAAIFLSNQT
jgi:hypothetical protein